MPAGLPAPLHLAASLLAVAAAVGLAVLVLARPTPSRRLWSSTVLALGCVLLAAGHGLAGALVAGSGPAIGWLRAVGLIACAIGLVPAHVGVAPARSEPSRSERIGILAVVLVAGMFPAVGIATVPAGVGLAVPVGTAAAATVAALAGAIAAVRGIVGGYSTLLAGCGFAAWSLAEVLVRTTLPGAAWATIAGAILLGGWLWQASSTQLLAKFVTAFVATLLAVVLLLSGVLSGVGSAALEQEQLRVLADVAQRSAMEVTEEWPRSAVVNASVVAESFASLSAFAESRSEEGVAQLRRRLFVDQDFLALLDADGEVLVASTDVGALEGGGFHLALSGSDVVEDLLVSEHQAGGLLTHGGRVVALGGVRVRPPDARAEDPPELLAVTGRVADDMWAARTAAIMGAELAVGIVVEVGGELSAASELGGGTQPEAMLSAASSELPRKVTVGDSSLFVADASLTDPSTLEPLGRVVAARAGAVLTAAERAQARQIFLIALLGALFAGCVAGLVTVRLVGPVRRLTVAAGAVREGNLATTAGVERADEVGELGRAFDEMTSSLSAQSAQLREAATIQSRLRARLEALTVSMGDGLVAVDPAGEIVTFNPAAEELTGRSAGSALGSPLDEVLVGEGPDGTPAAAALGSATSARVTAVRLLLERGDGHKVATAATAAPVRDPGGRVLGRVLVLRDISREAEVERMKTEFLSNVSHELRTPLTPIKGYAEVLARRDVDPTRTRRFAEEILSSTGRLERIVGLIVDFAALDSGRMRLRREPVDLRVLVTEALDDWRSRVPDRDFRRRLAADLPPVVGDPAMLRRCIDELLDNAVKFSPAGTPVSVTASMDEGSASNGRARVRLSIRDRGVGIDPEVAGSLFADFFQLDASETRHFGGLGLGLALVRRILDGLDAEVVADPAPDGGAVIHLLLQVASTEPVAPRRTARST